MRQWKQVELEIPVSAHRSSDSDLSTLCSAVTPPCPERLYIAGKQGRCCQYDCLIAIIIRPIRSDAPVHVTLAIGSVTPWLPRYTIIGYRTRGSMRRAERKAKHATGRKRGSATHSNRERASEIGVCLPTQWPPRNIRDR